MMKKTVTALAAAALIGPAVVSAQTLNYSYVEGGLAFYPGFENQDFMGLDLKGSYAITPEIFAFGGLKYLTDDVDLQAFHVGGAYRFAVDARTDVYGGLTIENQDIEVSAGGRTFSDSDTSLGIRGGVRHRLNEQLEIAGQIRLITGDWDYVGLTGTAQYFLSEQLGLIGEVDVYDGNLGLIGGARYQF